MNLVEVNGQSARAESSLTSTSSTAVRPVDAPDGPRCRLHVRWAPRKADPGTPPPVQIPRGPAPYEEARDCSLDWATSLTRRVYGPASGRSVRTGDARRKGWQHL